MSSAGAKIYIAGPMVFQPDAAGQFAAMKAILDAEGLEGVAPLDNQLGLEGAEPGRALARAIYEADEGLMRAVQGAIFNVDPFRRGTEMDPGTAFEVGYCKALGLPMTGWTLDGRPYPEKVRAFMADVFGEELRAGAPNASGATSGDLRDPDGMLVHSAGMMQNLMIEMAIEAQGGRIYAAPDWRAAFSEAAAHLARLVGAK
jgi:nucleoside 2-deoxyribosyltransferase